MSTVTSQWPMFREVLHRQKLMDEMMERCCVDTLALIRSDKGKSFAEARAKCRLCSSERVCREWLLAQTDVPAWPPEFCPNARLFRARLIKGA